MTFSKSYECLSHDLLIAKLEAYDLDKSSLFCLMTTYVFQNKGQKLSLHIVIALMLLRVFPRDLFPRYLFFNIFINDIFLFIEKFDICNFADDSTLFSRGYNLSVNLKSLEQIGKSF